MKFRDKYFKTEYKPGPCGKIMFDKKTAQTKRNLLMRKGKEGSLRIYQCPQCDAWHLTKHTREYSIKRKLLQKENKRLF